MKKRLLTLAMCLLPLSLFAQSTNPLNYSGKLFVSSYDIISTQRYVSFDDHAILNKEMNVPVIEIKKMVFDFENNVITSEDGTEHKIKVLQTKRYDMTDETWNVVISIDFLEDDKLYEFVWRQYGNPYFLVISKTDEGISGCRINLSLKPAASSPENALIQMLGSYGGF